MKPIFKSKLKRYKKKTEQEVVEHVRLLEKATGYKLGVGKVIRSKEKAKGKTLG